MKKYVPHILILIILVGLFSPMMQVNAQELPAVPTPPPISADQTAKDKIAKDAATAAAAKSENVFRDALLDSCGITSGTAIMDCLLVAFYYTYFQLPGFVLWLTAQFFNAMIAIGISSTGMATSVFLSTAWAVVRDLSNIFFILILLYIAIKMILGLGGSEVKKMIAHVVIMALLINFSMFFTKVVIDSSNILALVFYNNLDTKTINSDGTIRPFESTATTSVKDKDISGQMYKNFNPTKLIDGPFIEKMKMDSVYNNKTKKWETVGKATDPLPFSMALGIIVISGSIMLWAAYAFFIAGFMFLGRLIELWVLIIFSPFAFMSFTIPTLASVEYIGWESWSKRLISTSFMAPIFMFFMFLIFKLLEANIFNQFTNTSQDAGKVAIILGVLISASIIMALLLKATKFAEKGGGQFGEMVMKGGKMVAGLAVGAATGGAAMLATGTLGSLASRAMSSKGLQDAAKGTGPRGIAARMALKTADYGTKASFDVRNIPGAKALARAGGLNIESSKAIGLGIKEGGYEKTRADKVKKRQERAKQLEVREDEPLKQNLNNSEQDLQKMLNKVAKDFEEIDRDLVGARQKKSDAKEGTPDHDNAVADIKRLNGEKDNIKNGKTRDGTGVGVTVEGGVNDKKTIRQMEKEVIPEEKNKIVTENRERRRLYADRTTRYGKDVTVGGTTFYFGSEANREAAHKIRMEAKIESSSENKSHGGGGGGGHAPAPAHPPITPKAPTPRSGGGGGAPAASGGGSHGP